MLGGGPHVNRSTALKCHISGAWFAVMAGYFYNFSITHIMQKLTMLCVLHLSVPNKYHINL